MKKIEEDFDLTWPSWNGPRRTRLERAKMMVVEEEEEERGGGFSRFRRGRGFWWGLGNS